MDTPEFVGGAVPGGNGGAPTGARPAPVVDIPERDFLTLDALAGMELHTQVVLIDREGMHSVLMRELDAGEQVDVFRAAFETHSDGSVTFNPQLLELVRVAACLERPSLGPTVLDRIAALDKVRALPQKVFQTLSEAARELTNVDMARVANLARIIDGVPFLYRVLRLLTEKRGWLKDLDGVTTEELELWFAFYEAEEANGQRSLSELRSALGMG